MTNQQERLLREIYYTAKRYALNNDLRTQPTKFDIQENSQIKMGESNFVFEIKNLLYLEIQGYTEIISNLPNTIFITITEKGIETIKNLGFDYVSFYTTLLNTIADRGCNFFSIEKPSEFTDKLRDTNILKEAKIDMVAASRNETLKPTGDSCWIGSVKPEFLESLKKPISFNNQAKSIKEHMQDVIDSNDKKQGEELWEKIKVLNHFNIK